MSLKCHKHQYKNDESIVQQGDDDTGMFIVESGGIDVVVGNKIIASKFPGMIYMCLINKSICLTMVLSLFWKAKLLANKQCY